MTGRPTEYNEELAEEICEAIATTDLGLGALCKLNPHWPEERSIRRWIYRHPFFSHAYARAKECQMDNLVEEALEIARNGSRDTYIDDNGKEKCDHEWVQRSRLIVDTIKWTACKLKAKKYGDKLQVSSEIDAEALDVAKKKAKELMAPNG